MSKHTAGHIEIHMKDGKGKVRFFTVMHVITDKHGTEFHHPNGTTEFVSHEDIQSIATFPIY